jgi:hypothetical protein
MKSIKAKAATAGSIALGVSFDQLHSVYVLRMAG